MSTLAILGTGLAFPLVPQDGALATATGKDKVRQSIRMILETEPRERVMRPDFGCGLRRFLMQPNNAATRALIRREVERSLAAFEPRIEQVDVQVTAGADAALVEIRIGYVHRRDASPDTLVYPFYLETA